MLTLKHVLIETLAVNCNEEQKVILLIIIETSNVNQLI